MAKKSFVMYENWSTLLMELPAQEAGELIQAICHYTKTGECQVDNPVVSAMFTMIKQQLDEDAEKYEETCRKRAAAGKAGADATHGKSMAKGGKCQNDDGKSEQMLADNDNENDNDTDNVSLSTDNDIDNTVSNDTVVTLYNEICQSLPKCVKITDRRRRHIRQRLKDFDIKTLEFAFRKAEASDFLTGRSGDWRAGFDWIIGSEGNLTKILEGNYDNTGKKPQTTHDKLKQAHAELEAEYERLSGGL